MADWRLAARLPRCDKQIKEELHGQAAQLRLRLRLRLHLWLPRCRYRVNCHQTLPVECDDRFWVCRRNAFPGIARRVAGKTTTKRKISQQEQRIRDLERKRVRESEREVDKQ